MCKDYSPLKEIEDNSLLYDIYLKLDRCLSLISSLERVKERSSGLKVVKSDWLYRFVVCSEVYKNTGNTLYIKPEDVEKVIMELEEYKKSLLDDYTVEMYRIQDE